MLLISCLLLLLLLLLLLTVPLLAMVLLLSIHSDYSCHVVLQVILARGILIHVAAVLDDLFHGHPTALLYFVMVMCPLCMNLVQVHTPTL